MPQNFKTVDVARLEVEVDPAGLKNHVRNPDGRLGAWGWWTPVVGTTLEVSGSAPATGLSLKNILGSPIGTYAETENIACAPGTFVSGRVDHGSRSTTNETLRTRLVFLDPSGAVLSSGTQSAAVGTGTAYAPTTVAPAGTAFVRLRVDAYTSGGNLGSARYVVWNQAMLAQATTSAALTGYAYVEPIIWSNVLGPTHEITIDRDELNVGVLTATILDATLDPSQATGIRPGRSVRVTVKETSSGSWLPLFTGTITSGRTTYDYSRPNPAKRVRVTLEAADNVKTLANVPRPDGVADVWSLKGLLEGAGVPWVVDGSTSQLAAVGYVTRNENATALDQVAITRDSRLAYAWVSREGVINVWSADAISNVVKGSFTSADYTGLDVDFDTQRCINTVTVKHLRVNAATGETVEVPYGPYVDQASAKQWGPFAKEFTVQGLTDDAATMEAYAQSILAANATPTVRVNALSFAVTQASQFSTSRVLLDLYDRVTVTHNVTDDSRITGIKHSISPERWLVDLTFASENGVAQPTIAPVLATASPAAPKDTTWTALTTSNSSGTLKYRAASGWVQVEGSLTFTASLAANGNVNVLSSANSIPAAYRPSLSLNLTIARVNGGTQSGIVQRFTDGTINVTNASGAAVSTVQFAYSYPME